MPENSTIIVAGTDAIVADLEAGEAAVLLRDVVDLPEVPRRGGRKLNNRVPIRWAVAGVRGLKLETLNSPSGRITTRPAIRRFFSALSASATSNTSTTTRTPRRRQREHEAAERVLAGAGFKI